MGDDSLQRVTLTSREGCAESSTKGDESSRVAELLQRVTLMSHQGHAESSRRVMSRQGLLSHYRERP